jgi:hypothetical protein
LPYWIWSRRDFTQTYPRPVHVLIERAQGDIGQQRGQDASLRSAGEAVFPVAGLGEDSGLEECLHQREHAFVGSSDLSMGDGWPATGVLIKG